jgi:hypothetical protein
MAPRIITRFCSAIMTGNVLRLPYSLIIVTRLLVHVRRNRGLGIEAAHARVIAGNSTLPTARIGKPFCPRGAPRPPLRWHDVRLRTPLEPNIFIAGSVRVA